MNRVPWLTVVVILAFALAGPLAPWTALAQTATTGQQARMSELAYEPSAMLNDPLPPREPTVAHEVGAVTANVFHIPGKTILCLIGIGVGGALLAMTFGTGYRVATRTVEEGCGGTWVLTPEHLSGKAVYSGPES